MDIIFGRENADKLREQYIVLDLETVEQDGVSIEVFCLVSGDKVSLADMMQIDAWIKLHNDFLNGYRTKQYKFCRDCIDSLKGRFGGEVDTFYDEILRRINESEAQV